MTKNNDEIDLIELFSKIANWFASIFNKLIMFFIRNAFRLLIFVLLGIGLAIGNYFITERFYNTEMILKTNAVSSSEMVNFINNLNISTLTNNKPSKIKNIKAYYIIDINKDGIADYTDYENAKDTSITNKRMKNKISIRASVYENASIDSIKNAIISYINRNEYFQKVNKVRINQLENLIAKTNIELHKLDSVESINYFKRNPYDKKLEKNMMILNEKEMKLFHNDILRLYKLKQNYEKGLYLDKNLVTIIQDFPVATKVENSITKKLKNFVIIAFFIGLIYSIFIDQRKNLKALVKQSKK